MTALMSARRVCRNDGNESLRAAALAEIDGHLDNLKRCVHWLVAQGITILEADMRRGQKTPRLLVAASPWLHVLFRDDCANVARRQEGYLTTYKWIARRHGCDIVWHEVQA